MKKLIRITTVPYSMGSLLKNQFKFMSDYFEVIGISAPRPREFLDQIAREQGIRTISVDMTRKITPFKDLAGIFKLYRVFKKEKPFIVHTHTPKAGMVGMLAAYFAKVPHRLHTIAGLPLLEATGIKRKVLNFVEKLTYGCATKVLPNSYGLYDIVLKEKFAKPEKLKVIGNGSSNGIDTSHYNPDKFSTEFKRKLRSSLKIDENDFVYVFVGRLVKDKGINELVSAFNQLSSENDNLKLLLVGAYEKELDPLEKDTHQSIETNRAIILTGPQKDVRPYFSISDLLVFPSYREGFPNVVMEAGAMGLPTIATDINGCNEIITNDKNGFLISPKNRLELANSMKELHGNKTKLEELAENSRLLITSRFERKFVWKELLKEYKSLE